MSTSRKVLITPRSARDPSHPSIQRLIQSGYSPVFPADRESLPNLDAQLRFAPEIVGYVAGVEQIGEEFFSQAPLLRVISRNGVGVDSIDLEAAERHSVAVRVAPGANSRGVAELVIALIFGFSRGLAIQSGAMREGVWNRQPGFELEGKVLGLVGFGQVARIVAKLASGLGMRIVANDPFVADESEGVRMLELDQLLVESNFVSLHCPPTDRPLISEAQLRLMSGGTYLINTARAGLVDSDAAVSAMKEGILAGWATDVFETEPPVVDERFQMLNFVPTPHIGGYTRESIDRAIDAAVSNLLEVLES